MSARGVVVRVSAAGPDEMHDVGERLGQQLQAGDLVILTGALGAGKTTLAQGIGKGLGTRGPVTSPTFVIARLHPSLRDGPPLVHVDAYRLSSLAEVDDLDLDADMDRSVTVVEWGAEKVEQLASDRLEVSIERESDDTEVRHVTIAGVGGRWHELIDSLR